MTTKLSDLLIDAALVCEKQADNVFFAHSIRGVGNSLSWESPIYKAEYDRLFSLAKQLRQEALNAEAREYIVE